MAFDLTYKPYGEHAVLIEWPAIINRDILMDVLFFRDNIVHDNIKSIINITSGYTSLLVSYDELNFDFKIAVKALKTIRNQKHEPIKSVFHKWRIPVCYDMAFGVDLEVMALEKNMSVDDIIKRHSETSYTVYFIGFLPGFLYLGGLDESLHIPRKETPRLQIEKGAVAIGGKQTGVYPGESPGGWHIIGNTPISFFDPSKSSPCFAKPGDTVTFYPVSLKAHQDIKTLVKAGVYQIESEVIDD